MSSTKDFTKLRDKVVGAITPLIDEGVGDAEQLFDAAMAVYTSGDSDPADLERAYTIAVGCDDKPKQLEMLAGVLRQIDYAKYDLRDIENEVAGDDPFSVE